MSANQPKDTALKTKEKAFEAISPPAQTTVLSKKETSITTLSLFNQLDCSSNNTASLTVTPSTQTTTNTPSAAFLTAAAPFDASSAANNIDLKPPVKPRRSFSTPSSIAIVLGTKRGSAAVTGSIVANNINAFRSHLYQSVRKNATTKIKITNATPTRKTAGAAPR
ncbi:hypothetical protein KR009_009620 [Drosophila setifemur]|nr:hypothetical protein KR009_009620 [Drosophila setifemur]